MNDEKPTEEFSVESQSLKSEMRGLTDHKDPEKPVHIKRAHRFIYGYLTLLVLAALTGLSGYLYHHYHDKLKATASSNSTSIKTNTQAQLSSDVCFIAAASLQCTDANGQNLVSYNLPSVGGNQITSLVPNDNNSQYLGLSNGSWWLLSNKLSAIKQLKFPAGLTYNTTNAVSWSHDGNYLFIELDGANNDRQIYKYALATGAVTKLTSQGFNSSPYQTQDGHIIYTYFSGTGGGWMPYIMNADGSGVKALTVLSNPKPLPNSDATEFAGLSYDPITDTIFVDNFGTTGKIPSGSLSYVTVADLLKGATAPKTINLDVQSSGDGNIFRLSGTSIIWPDSTSPGVITGQIVDLKTGTVMHTVSQYGTPIGMLRNLKLASLTPNAYAGWKTGYLHYEKISYAYPASWAIKDLSRASPKGLGGCVYPGDDYVILTSPTNKQVTLHTGIDCIGDAGAQAFSAIPLGSLGQSLYLALEANTGDNQPNPTGPSFACLAHSRTPDTFLDFTSKNIYFSGNGSPPTNYFCYYPYDSQTVLSRPISSVKSIEASKDFNDAKLIFESMGYE